ncbi:hypothetical protein Rhopal_001012-T1 [Rhodotorula paludigena]|uniref:Proteophosphoglycan ppg4 n=1 Tax=Rhodotorula paludigena TaxID=86838 RepID=A0AAV5G663_9BASI|nr:hypothetical protein Rhopal_001012-T1 [Rhodotorula paludigena]
MLAVHDHPARLRVPPRRPERAPPPPLRSLSSPAPPPSQPLASELASTFSSDIAAQAYQLSGGGSSDATVAELIPAPIACGLVETVTEPLDDRDIYTWAPWLRTGFEQTTCNTTRGVLAVAHQAELLVSAPVESPVSPSYPFPRMPHRRESSQERLLTPVEEHSSPARPPLLSTFSTWSSVPSAAETASASSTRSSRLLDDMMRSPVPPLAPTASAPSPRKATLPQQFPPSPPPTVRRRDTFRSPPPRIPPWPSVRVYSDELNTFGSASPSPTCEGPRSPPPLSPAISLSTAQHAYSLPPTSPRLHWCLVLPTIDPTDLHAQTPLAPERYEECKEFPFAVLEGAPELPRTPALSASRKGSSGVEDEASLPSPSAVASLLSPPMPSRPAPVKPHITPPSLTPAFTTSRATGRASRTKQRGIYVRQDTLDGGEQNGEGEPGAQWAATLDALTSSDVHYGNGELTQGRSTSLDRVALLASQPSAPVLPRSPSSLPACTPFSSLSSSFSDAPLPQQSGFAFLTTDPFSCSTPPRPPSPVSPTNSHSPAHSSPLSPLKPLKKLRKKASGLSMSSEGTTSSWLDRLVPGRRPLRRMRSASAPPAQTLASQATPLIVVEPDECVASRSRSDPLSVAFPPNHSHCANSTLRPFAPSWSYSSYAVNSPALSSSAPSSTPRTPASATFSTTPSSAVVCSCGTTPSSASYIFLHAQLEQERERSRVLEGEVMRLRQVVAELTGGTAA